MSTFRVQTYACDGPGQQVTVDGIVGGRCGRKDCIPCCLERGKKPEAIVRKVRVKDERSEGKKSGNGKRRRPTLKGRGRDEATKSS